MSDYRRRRQPGGTYFFTVVTHRRQPIFDREEARRILHEAIKRERGDRPFVIDAAVLLPDHLHMLWTLPVGDDDYSTRWKTIKGGFTHAWLALGGAESAVTPQSRHEGRRGVWQRRFMEHTIRDDDDYLRHIEYIHYNPVKHGHAACPKDWPHSSFHRFVREGIYDVNWCCQCDQPLPPTVTFQADWLE